MGRMRVDACPASSFCIMNDSPDMPASIRTLKIETVGDFWRGLIKPKIRLTGHWLERAGFKPGANVQVICVAPGVIELRSVAPGTQPTP